MSKERKLRICGRQYHLQFNPNKSGGYFNTCKLSGDGLVEIGTRNRALADVAERVFHEVAEVVSVESGKRFHHYRSNSDDPDYLFVFNHDDFTRMVPEIIDGLVSSGFFRVVDGLPKKEKGKK